MERSAAQRLTLRIIGCAGAALFACFFFLTYHTPHWVEDFAASYLEKRVTDHVDATIDGLGAPQGDDALSRYAANLYKQNEGRIYELRQRLKASSRAQMASRLAQIRSMTPEQRELVQLGFEAAAEGGIGLLQLENRQLVALIQSGYLKIAAELKREIRGFTAINAFAFLLLVLVSFLKPDGVRILFVPGVLLCVSTLLCAYLYVFGQNWLLNMIHGSYVGKIYGLYLGVTFLFLCDVMLNRGRVTALIVTGISIGPSIIRKTP
jgi:hypothetical protein